MRYRYQYRDKQYEVHLEPGPDGIRLLVNGKPVELEVVALRPGEIIFQNGGRAITLFWATDGDRRWISLDGCTYLLETPSLSPTHQTGDQAAEELLRAPMPAQVRSIEVGAGDKVERGQTLLLLEAMKMEIRLKASRKGEVRRVLVEAGQSVDRGEVLVELEAEHDQ
jgi:acetyl/propionyl-CoA carboxylase alpha subunit